MATQNGVNASPSGARPGVVVAVMVVAALLAVLVAWLVDRGEQDSPVSAVGGVLAKVKDGDVSGAYSLLCADERAQMSLADFETQVAQIEGELGNIESFTMGEVFEFAGGANVEYRLTTEKAGTTERQMLVEREGDQWRPCALRGAQEGM